MILEKSVLQEVIDKGLSTGADFAEVFAEDTIKESIGCIGGNVENISTRTISGVGIRLAQGLRSVYGYTNNVKKDNLLKLAADLAASFSGSIIKAVPLKDVERGEHHKAKVYMHEAPLDDKIALLKKALKAAKDYSEEIVQVMASLGGTTQNVLIANNSGLLVEDTRASIRFSIQAIASNGKEMQYGYSAPGASKGFEFMSDLDVEKEAIGAAKTAIAMLHADDCPSGEMTVVIDNGFGGVIFHEACGHSLEATSVAKNASVFCGKLGERVAKDIVTAIDDGTIENSWGSENFDDEGNKQQRRVLIEKGILKTYMIDELNARRMKMKNTGSSRRESYKYAPTSRMSNTYIANGESKFEDLIANTEYGLYAKKLGGGSVDPGSGDFNFSVGEGYIIRNGKIAEAVRGAALVGNGADTLMKIDMVADNCLRAQGVCGSLSGSVNADVGQPTIRVSKMTVGGKKGAN